MKNYNESDKKKWRTGLYAANPQQMQELMVDLDARRFVGATRDGGGANLTVDEAKTLIEKWRKEWPEVGAHYDRVTSYFKRDK